VDNYAGSYLVALGNALGNIKVEKETIQPAYFMNKKLYYIENDFDHKTSKIMKGIPASSIKKDGEKYDITNKDLFERVYNRR
jgi:hypothetical protein